MGETMLCECCHEKPGSTTQGPWPLPVSTCHCNDCYALESIAFSVWRELNPGLSKFNAPIPFLKGKQDYPPETLKGKASELREWLRHKIAAMV